MKKRINIKFSNKTFYTFSALAIIALLAMGVYAYGGTSPSTMGHSAGEINGVCKWAGVGAGWIDCPPTQEDLGMYIRSSDNALCYETSGASSCALSSQTCTASMQTNPYQAGICAQQASIQSALCTQTCNSIMACSGDSTPFSCGSFGVVYFSSSVLNGCSGDTLSCICSVSASYQREIANNEICIIP